ncbi:hypothetical protein I6A60_36940 [Frankia sp. AgB1.9]|uniref:hypothetical protein n=1 Tax=unclassified Frankia TaxID=2632575 RepID=UPI001933A50B|nr:MULTISPECIES: hypothetical protein [unclassified Frankia]MBL7491387.1 hypothetical protein [Frankia sp. AgW1.1]MBL7553396.1 hypothetical protein [Frankia sp. AgB1.9]MBL7617857.1 hypothetical protein [Frankia sp. AgB1.8]
MERDEADFDGAAEAGLRGCLDVGWWRGTAQGLLAAGFPILGSGLTLLYHALDGLLASPLEGEPSALRARTEITRAIGELEFAGVHAAVSPVSVGAAEDCGPLGWEEIRVVLRAAVEVLRAQVATAADPVPVAQAVIATRRALAELG